MDARPKRKRAVALKYDAEDKQAPTVTAKGQGEIAERIIALAEQHDVPLYEDPDLVEVLSSIDLGREIPEDLYKAVAEVSAFVYRMNGTFSKTS
ncbi:MAG: EscU/YscU/HrcU family type III secretion system export apparatus switch protein [Candidatus Hinthialibacter antarcticus]|nr:EscU/YscU/HrcU family type III secretion system export apparatus switch protein [Candidatus Hinthialibacter antarcticus]